MNDPQLTMMFALFFCVAMMVFAIVAGLYRKKLRAAQVELEYYEILNGKHKDLTERYETNRKTLSAANDALHSLRQEKDSLSAKVKKANDTLTERRTRISELAGAREKLTNRIFELDLQRVAMGKAFATFRAEIGNSVGIAEGQNTDAIVLEVQSVLDLHKSAVASEQRKAGRTIEEIGHFRSTIAGLLGLEEDARLDVMLGMLPERIGDDRLIAARKEAATTHDKLEAVGRKRDLAQSACEQLKRDLAIANKTITDRNIVIDRKNVELQDRGEKIQERAKTIADLTKRLTAAQTTAHQARTGTAEHRYEVRDIEGSPNKDVYVGDMRLCVLGQDPDGSGWRISLTNHRNMKALGFTSIGEVKQALAPVLKQLNAPPGKPRASAKKKGAKKKPARRKSASKRA